MESQPHNPKFRNDPENFHPCVYNLINAVPLSVSFAHNVNFNFWGEMSIIHTWHNDPWIICHNHYHPRSLPKKAPCNPMLTFTESHQSWLWYDQLQQITPTLTPSINQYLSGNIFNPSLFTLTLIVDLLFYSSLIDCGCSELVFVSVSITLCPF